MSQSEIDKTEWLTLSEAAERLNVHSTTLRRWADEGQIPCMLTPGGHRRFAASDVAHLAERRHAVRGIGPVERIWAAQALKRTRDQIAARPRDGWFEHHDIEARNRGRELGQDLMALTLRYLTGDEESDEISQEAREIGRKYGLHGEELRLPLTEVLQASMFFRDALVTAAIELPDNVRIPKSSQTRLLGRINRLLNLVQLGVADVYDDRRGDAPLGDPNL
jgi:excisionase family DNA binding protein